MKCVIIGAGLAGHNAAMELRRLSQEVSITLLGAEVGRPYNRPPLSKEYLLGAAEVSQIAYPDSANYASLRIDYHSATEAVAIDRVAQTVETSNGTQFSYDRLLIATGSRVRRLRGVTLQDLYYLRTVEDAVALRARLHAGVRLAVIGGGFIGLEVAATAKRRGCEVTVIEAQERLASRGMPPLVSEALLQMHQSQGVAVRLGCTVGEITMRPGGGMILETTQGTLAVDLVVAGIGVVPNVELAQAAGLMIDNGILVDDSCRTSDRNIFAAGEITSHPNWDGVCRRIESWKTASDQPLTAARAMLGMAAQYKPIPWLWSDQFDSNLQVLGVLEDAVSYMLSGEISQPQWTMVAINADGQTVGAAAMNNGRHISMIRRAMERGAPCPDVIADGARTLPGGPY